MTIDIYIDSAEKREGLPEYNDGPCPICGKPTQEGFGLAGGGFGIYTYCEEHGIVSKSVVEE